MRGQCRLWFLFGALALVAQCQDAGDEAEPEDMPPPMEGSEEGSEEGDDANKQDALTSDTIRALHAKMDKNKDGKVPMAEMLHFAQLMRRKVANADIPSAIEQMDGDKDGKLSLPELLKDMESWGHEGEEAATAKEMETAKFRAADDDGNGLLDKEELASLFSPELHDGVLALTAEATLKSKDTDGNGELTLKEFWEGSTGGREDQEPLTPEEQADFAKLDVDKSGTLNLKEVKHWESGGFHTEEALKKLFELADHDKDMMVTADELDTARELVASTDAHYHLMEWAEHHGEL